MKCCSLFSGIGGFDLAAEWLGWDIIVQCEIDPFCRRVLKHHFPKAILYEDIKKTDFTKHAGDIDIVFGGFPCQPFSVAGQRKGADDDRYLWPEMFRVIRDVSPRYVVAENVSGLITQQSGMVFETVLSDLENEGYEVQPFIIPACAVGAPHRRDRVWIIAHSDRTYARRCGYGEAGITDAKNEGEGIIPCDGFAFSFDGKRVTSNPDSINGNGTGLYTSGIPQFEATEVRGTITNTDDIGLQRFGEARDWRNGFEDNSTTVTDPASAGLQRCNWRFIQSSGITGLHKIPDWLDFPTQSPFCWRNDGLSGRLAGITFSSWRRQSIKALGNAIVPQVAYEIFKAIEQTEYIINLNRQYY